jgi:hypothetical protein
MTMASFDARRTCFVIMPFGEKKDLDGQEIDFDDIYRFFFKKAIEELGIDCIRCDEIEESGSIHDKMFEHIYQADVVVVDITTSNANVYYELGVRHALAKSVTVLIRRKGTTIPFNIQGLQVVEYDQAKFSSIERAKSRIVQIIKNGLDQRHTDSPVHSVLDLNIEPEGKPLAEMKFYEFQLTGTDTAIGLITGEIQNVTRGVDVWVNSENTNMQMARPFENSISGIIRYHGAEKEDGLQVKDTVALALAAKMKGRVSVSPAEVLVTTSGAMKTSHKVERIFHAAAVVGQVGKGYTPIADVASCVVNALDAVKNSPKDCAGADLKSILFPLFGTRSSRKAGLENRVKPLINAAIEYLINNPDCSFKRVYFLAYTDKELEVCQGLLRSDSRLKPLGIPTTTLGKLVAEPQVAQSPASMPTTSPFEDGADPTTGGVADTPKAGSNHSKGAARSAPSRTARKHPKSS